MFGCVYIFDIFINTINFGTCVYTNRNSSNSGIATLNSRLLVKSFKSLHNIMLLLLHDFRNVVI